MKYFKIGFLFLLLVLVNCGSNQEKRKKQADLLLKEVVDFTHDYELVDKEFGTKTIMKIENDKRVMVTNQLPNHKTGAFPNQGNPNSITAQDLEYTFPLIPKFSGKSKWAREPGIAVNGVKFAPGTAERFVCETGEVYKVEAFQELIDLGLDFNHAHVQPTGAYHYHGVPTALVDKLDNGNDVVLIGYAKDGFPMYYSKSGKYKPSYQLSKDSRTGEYCEYRNPKQGMEADFENTRPDGTFVSDWIYKKGLGALDECNGMEINGEYGYFVTKEYPYISRCLKGVFTEERHHHSNGGHRHRHDRSR